MEKERKHHTASYKLSRFLNTPENFSYTWLTGNMISILRYIYDVIEMTYNQTQRSICKQPIPKIALCSRVSEKTVKRSLPILIDHKFLSEVQKNTKSPTHYGIGTAIENWFTKTLEERNSEKSRVTMTLDEDELEKSRVTMTLALGSPRPQISPIWGHSDPTYKKAFKKDYKKERARTNRAPLSPDFKPDQKRIEMASETARLSGKTVEQLIAKFINLKISKEYTSAYWDGEFENFLIDEKPAKGGNVVNIKPDIKQSSCVSQEWGAGHPSWESLHQGNKLNGNGKGSRVGENQLPAQDSFAGNTGLRKVTDYLF